MLRELDQIQEDKPKRPHRVEAILYPIPSVKSRLQRFRDGWEGKGAWNAARYALNLSWPFLALPEFPECRRPPRYKPTRALGDVASGLTG